MKTCSKCGKDKPKEAFPKRKRNKDGLSGFCKTCKQAYDNNYYSSTPGRKNQIRTSSTKQVESNRSKMSDYLNSQKCVDCGEDDPIVLEFDHIDPNTKSGNIGSMMTSAYSWERLLQEIHKCEVVCANCHRRRTAKTYGFWKVTPV